MQLEIPDHNKSPLGLLLLLSAILITGGLISALNQDQALFYKLNQSLRFLPDAIWMNISNLGTTMAGAALLSVLTRKHPVLLLHLLLTGLACTLLIYFLKGSLGVIRPHLLLDTGSFHFITTQITSGARPSGHATTAFFLLGTAMTLKTALWLRSSLLLLALIIALSRIAIGVHWPLDLIWGAAIGSSAGFTGAYLLTKLELSKQLTRRLRMGQFLLMAAFLLYYCGDVLPYPEHNTASYLILFSLLAYGLQDIARNLFLSPPA